MPSITLKAIAAAGCFFALVSFSNNFHAESLQAGNSIEDNLVNLSLALEQDSQNIVDESSARNTFAKADLLETRGQIERAMALYKKIIDHNFSTELTFKSHHRRAQILVSQKELKQAEYEYSTYINKANPGILKSLAYSYRAEVYEKQGEPGQAGLDREKIARFH